MKISERINKINGVKDSAYFYDEMALYVYYDSALVTLDSLHIKISRAITDVQLLDSFKKFIYQEHPLEEPIISTHIGDAK